MAYRDMYYAESSRVIRYLAGVSILYCNIHGMQLTLCLRSVSSCPNRLHCVRRQAAELLVFNAS